MSCSLRLVFGPRRARTASKRARFCHSEPKAKNPMHCYFPSSLHCSESAYTQDGIPDACDTSSHVTRRRTFCHIALHWGDRKSDGIPCFSGCSPGSKTGLPSSQQRISHVCAQKSGTIWWLGQHDSMLPIMQDLIPEAFAFRRSGSAQTAGSLSPSTFFHEKGPRMTKKLI